MSEDGMITAASRFRVAHASRVSGFGVAPKRTFPRAISYPCTLFAFKPAVGKVREPETASPTREMACATQSAEFASSGRS
jgi:hypothetical protein